MQNKKFVCTTEAETADLLRKLGYQELPKQNGRYMFLNNNKLVFDSEDMKDVHYTDMLTI